MIKTENPIVETSFVSNFELYLGLVRKQLMEGHEADFFIKIDNKNCKNYDLINSYRKISFPDELSQRYMAIKQEIKQFNPDYLFIGACGLSPLGYVISKELPNTFVIDSDLPEIIEYKESKGFENTNNYVMVKQDVLDDFTLNYEGKIAVVVEGLTLYLTRKQNDIMHHNIKNFIGNNKNLILMDYFIANGSAKNTELEDDFDDIAKEFLKPIYDNEKFSLESHQKVIDYLSSHGYRNIQKSRFNVDDKQTVWVFES
ncbi:hypothetical protein ACFL1H_01865 [Nanoarchaeota archaeon]